MRLVLTTAVLVCCLDVAWADIAPDPLAAMGNVQLMKGKAPDIRMASEVIGPIVSMIQDRPGEVEIRARTMAVLSA